MAAAASPKGQTYVVLGKDRKDCKPHKMPVVGLGTWRSDPALTEAAVKTALLCGYRHLDCAALYMNEAEVGRGIAAAMKEDPSLKREDFFVTSKVLSECSLHCLVLFRC